MHTFKHKKIGFHPVRIIGRAGYYCYAGGHSGASGNEAHGGI